MCGIRQGIPGAARMWARPIPSQSKPCRTNRAPPGPARFSRRRSPHASSASSCRKRAAAAPGIAASAASTGSFQDGVRKNSEASDSSSSVSSGPPPLPAPLLLLGPPLPPLPLPRLAVPHSAWTRRSSRSRSCSSCSGGSWEPCVRILWRMIWAISSWWPAAGCHTGGAASSAAAQ
jgi:hypothetical protein